ncbi:MAG: CheY-like chemotaxis protein [Myxococcota bacterium]
MLQTRSPDLVLCDLSMPNLGGAELYRRVREQRPELAPRFVFMTGAADLPGSRSFLEGHEGPVLLKPFSLSQLAEVLMEAHSALLAGSVGD